MNWLIPFPGDWHVCKNYQKVLMKIYWHAGLKNMAEKAGNKTKILNSLEKCGNFQKTHNFLIQSFHAGYVAKLMHFMKAYLLMQTKPFRLPPNIVLQD